MKTDNYVSTIVEAKFKVKLTTADTQNFGTKTTRFFFFFFFLGFTLRCRFAVPVGRGAGKPKRKGREGEPASFTSVLLMM